MKVVIPAKTNSERVLSKNWRPFYKGKSLVDLNIEAWLAAGIPASDIYVSCNDPALLEMTAKRWGIQQHLRELTLCENVTPLTTWIRSTCADIPGESEIIWSQVCDPLFREHKQVLEEWPQVQDDYDSLCVVHRAPPYLLDPSFRPLGWQFGEWHIRSQTISRYYAFPFTVSILPRATIARTGYHLGVRPAFFEATGLLIDIDTPEDFAVAQVLYKAQQDGAFSNR